MLMASPTLITALATVVGLRAWYWQLIAKRRFEVAEQTVVIAVRTVDALSRIRSIFITLDELQATEVPDHLAPEDVVKALRRARAIRKRVDNEEAVFAEARAAQIIASLHLAKEASAAIQQLIDARRDVRIASEAYALAFQEGVDANEEQTAALNARVRQCENQFWEMRDHNRKPTYEDKLSARIDAAMDSLTATCKPYLREQTFWEFVWSRAKPKSLSER